MKKYCIDTSGLSMPWQELPYDIHRSIWTQVVTVLESGVVAVTVEIYDEMTHITGELGDCINNNKSAMVLEVGKDEWDHALYLEHASALNTRHHAFISEYCKGGKRDGTVCLNDISIIALAMTLKLPVVSMEKRAWPSTERRKIPDVCILESVEHMTFNDFLRRETIKS